MSATMYSFITSCLYCLPTPQRKERPASPQFRSTRYNAQLRNILGLAERPLHLPAQVESEQTGQPPARGPLPMSEAPSRDAAGALAREQSPPRVRSQRRFPTAVNVEGGDHGTSQKPRWATSNLDPSELAELFNVLHRTLDHVPYAICGLGALIDHGFTARRANKVSILCPAYSKDIIKGWARARGFDTYGDSVGLPMRDGAVRRVRIKYLDEGFDRLERVRSSLSPAAVVLSLPSQLDNVAAGWLDNQRRGDARALRTIARDVFWCLDRLARTHTPHPDPRFLPTFLGEAFWVPFTELHPYARPEAARAGIDVAAVLAGHRNAAALREHSQMLRDYGVDDHDVVVDAQPGLFENMRTLENSKSVYTLRDSRSASVGQQEEKSSGETRKLQKKKKKKKYESVPKKSKVGWSKQPGAVAESSSGSAGNRRSLTRSKSAKAPSSPLRISAPIPPERKERPSAEWV